MEDGEESGTLEREDDPDSRIVDKGILVRKTGTTSDVWKTFQIWSKAPTIANCNLCQANVPLGKRSSTSKLTQHMNRHHAKLIRSELLEQADRELADLLSLPVSGSHQPKISLAFSAKVAAHDFPSKFSDWQIATYQPNDTCENQEFRDMCYSLNPKAAVIGKDKHQEKLLLYESMTKSTLKAMLKKNHFVLRPMDGLHVPTILTLL